jgi:hypothetical protein
MSTDSIEGTVSRRSTGAGSKSERDAVVIDTADGTFLLRRRGGNAFADADLDGLVGHRARLHGRALSTTFVVDDWVLLDEV